MNKRSRGWCYTINNYDEYQKESIKLIRCKYHVFGEEKGEQKDTPHLQGFLYFENPQRGSTIESKLKAGTANHAHLETQAGTPLQAAEYCKKDGNFWECGELPQDQKKQGEKEKEKWEEIWKFAKENKLEDIPAKQRVMYYKTFLSIAKDFDTTKPDCPDIVLKDWQQNLFDALQEPVDSRIMHIIIDPVGGAGKSTFCRYLINKLEGVHIFGSGASKDIAYAIKQPYPKICLFDFARCTAEARPWNIVEQVKNGMVFNSKYESGMKYFPTPHVVVFTNQEPEQGKLSLDRMNCVYLSESFIVPI